MSNYETNYFSDFDPADPLGGIDHARICNEVLSELMAGESMVDALIIEQGYQMRFDKRTYDDLSSIGAYLLPPGADVSNPEDNAKFSTYLSGAAVALKVVDAMATSIDLDPAVFRGAWHNNGFVKVIDINAPIFKDKTDLEKFESVGDGVIVNGDEFLRIMKPEYQSLIDTISDNHPAVTEPHILKASYGYVLGYAMDTLARILIELEYRNQIAGRDMEEGLQHMLEEPISTQFADDNNIANFVDSALFYDEDNGPEAVFGREIMRLVDKDDELVETLQRLALVQHPNELGNGALDENGEAFFYGCILGLMYAEMHCEALDIDFDHANRKWRKESAHSKLNQDNFNPGDRVLEVDRQVTKTLIGTDLSVATHSLLDKISHRFDHEEDEAIAFKNGLHYVLESYKRTLQRCIDSKIRQRVRLASASLDDEIKKLLSD